MAVLPSATVILCVKRDDFIVIASDRLTSWLHGTAGYGTSQHCKIHLSTHSAAAIATSGVTLLPEERATEFSNMPSTSGLVEDLLKEKASSATEYCAIAAERFSRRVIVARDIEESKTGRRSYKFGMMIGVVDGKTPTMAKLLMTDRVHILDKDECQADIPDALSGFFHDRRDSERFWGFQFVEPERLAQHLKSGIEAAIRRESKIVPPNEVRCGGGVDVAIVTRDLARFL